MKRKYQAAFILPAGARKKLGEDGWEFETSNRLPLEFKECLIDSLGLSFLSEKLEIEIYSGFELEVSFFYDVDQQIEFVHIKVYGDGWPSTLSVIRDLKLAGAWELFVPDKKGETGTDHAF